MNGRFLGLGLLDVWQNRGMTSKFYMRFGRDDNRAERPPDKYIPSDQRTGSDGIDPEVNYGLKCAEDRLEKWKRSVEKGGRVALTQEQMKEQAIYRKQAKARGRSPSSYEMRHSGADEIRKKTARDKIERLRMIKEFSEL
jgi:hypothetical protein